MTRSSIPVWKFQPVPLVLDVYFLFIWSRWDTSNIFFYIWVSKYFKSFYKMVFVIHFRWNLWLSNLSQLEDIIVSEWAARSYRIPNQDVWDSCMFAGLRLLQLNHEGRNKMASILKTTFSNTFPPTKHSYFESSFTKLCSQGSDW